MTHTHITRTNRIRRSLAKVNHLRLVTTQKLSSLKVNPRIVLFVSCSLRITMSLIARLKNLHKPVEAEIPLHDMSQYSLAEMEDFKINFGKTYVGQTYKSVWDTNQPYIQWFLARWGNSVKLEHRLFLHYIECKIDQAELRGEKVPVAVPSLSTPSTSTNQPGGKSTPAKAVPQGKSKTAPKPKAMMPDAMMAPINLTEEEEDSGWTVMPEHVQFLEQRMAQMESAIQTIAHHLEAMTTPIPQPTPDGEDF